MPKKKKTQLKPVARGFATTSVPKKTETLQTETHLEAIEQATAVVEDQDQGLHEGASVSENKSNSEEYGELQKIVEKYQDKVEKEILRTIKSIEYDRRLSKSFPTLMLDTSLILSIFQLAKEFSCPSTQSLIDNSEERLLVRLGVTFGILRRLGFSENRVSQCITQINGIELDEALEWLYIHCDDDELYDEDRKRDPQEATNDVPIDDSLQNTTNIQRTTQEIKQSSKVLDDNNSKSESPPRNIVLLERYVKPHPLVITGSGNLDLDSEHSSPREGDPIETYIKLKLRISELSSALATRQTNGNNSGSYELLLTLRAQLDEMTRDILFDEDFAEAEFQRKLEEKQSSTLEAILRGDITVPTFEETIASERSSGNHSHVITSDVSNDIFDEEEDFTSGGLLALLEPISSVEYTVSGTTVRVRDMALPKHYTGRTSKALLNDVVLKADRKASITYKDISGSSRAKRASLTIQWTDERLQSWAMSDVACYDTIQAENYVATLAMHRIVYPSVLGFAATVVGTGSSTSYRYLPPIFRTLWDELEAERKANNDNTNRQIWATLKEHLHRKIVNNKKDYPKQNVFESDVAEVTKGRSVGRHIADVDEQLIMTFQARQMSQAYQAMLIQRNMLPIANYRKTIIDALEHSSVIVLSGETGCGKSTQVPSFILEDQLSKGSPCKIVCTEPRRISAITLAQRVSRELGDGPGMLGTSSSLVGYSIRLESHTTRHTRLTFVTNGIALRMLESGAFQGTPENSFGEVTHIIIDEVHERSIESDFLLIVLKSLLERKEKLKIVLMSATVDAEKISSFFGGCPVVQVPGRTYPVEIKYLEDTIEYCQWHISESSQYARRERDKYSNGKNRIDWSEDTATIQDDDEDETAPKIFKLARPYAESTLSTINLLDERLIPYELIIRLLEKLCFEDPKATVLSAAILIFMPGLGEIRRLIDTLMEHRIFGSSAFRIYPLHSTISSENQAAVFEIPPNGVRKIVIATNIAETGVTIPDITCVIDTGKHREMRFDEKRQLSRLVETSIARSNAAQRRGRAGRVRPGICFHLFTKFRHDMQMAEHPLPEMMRLSLSDLALRIKILKIDLGSSIEEVLSKALDPPIPLNIQRAVSSLVEVKALTATEEITSMGRLLSKLPTDVHLGKFLLVAALFRCLDPALTIAAVLSSKSPFLSPLGLEQEADRAKLSFKIENSDFWSIHNAFASWRKMSVSQGNVQKYCKQNFLSHQNLLQIEELRQQFFGYLIDASFVKVDETIIRELNSAKFTRQKLKFVMIPPNLDVSSPDRYNLLNAALCAGLYPKLLTVETSKNIQQLRTVSNNQLVHIHPSSVNYGMKPSYFGTNYLSYFTIMQSKKLYAWETGPVEDIAIFLLCGDCEFKLASNSTVIDRKIKFRIGAKSNVALKYLRTQLTGILSTQFKGETLTQEQKQWYEMAMKVLGKVICGENDNVSSVGMKIH